MRTLTTGDGSAHGHTSSKPKDTKADRRKRLHCFTNQVESRYEVVVEDRDLQVRARMERYSKEEVKKHSR